MPSPCKLLCNRQYLPQPWWCCYHYGNCSWKSHYATALYTHSRFTLNVFVLTSGSLDHHLLLAEACNLKGKHYSSLPLSTAHLTAGLTYLMMSDISSRCCLNIRPFGMNLNWCDPENHWHITHSTVIYQSTLQRPVNVPQCTRHKSW